MFGRKKKEENIDRQELEDAIYGRKYKLVKYCNHLFREYMIAQHEGYYTQVYKCKFCGNELSVNCEYLEWDWDK